MNSCPKYESCANADIKCHLCKNFSCYAAGSSYGKGRKAEKDTVRALNTKATLRPGSGASAVAKGDIISAGTLHEVKSGYGKGSFSVKKAWLDKIAREAIAEGKIPVLDIHFDGTPDNELYSIIRLETLQDLIVELNELRNKNA